MGAVASRQEDGAPLLVRDQLRLSVSNVKITTGRGRNLYTITPNAFPATRYNVKKEDDDTNIEYVQDPDTSSSAPPSFLLRLSNDEDIIFYFTFSMQQTQNTSTTSSDLTRPSSSQITDTIINSLTFIFASTPKELDALVTREFNANPNIHKHSNVDLVGDYTTGGKQVEQFEWSWKWRPPKQERDRGGGWRNTCSFVEYDQRAHRLSTLVTFSFWMQNDRRLDSPRMSSPRMSLTVPPRIRVPSTQTIDSRMSDSEGEMSWGREPPSPIDIIPTIYEYGLGLETSSTNNPIKVDLNCQKPGEDPSMLADGPLFRSTLKQMEMKTVNMRARMKKVLKKAEAAKEAQITCNASIAAFMEALREASSSNANAVQPAIDHYFEKIASEILSYERQNTVNLQKLIIDPLSKLYTNDIKQVESKKKDFDEETKEFYSYVSRYLGKREDSMKDKKRAEVDSKYENKRRTFELKRFEYSSFMQDLHGGRKDQEVLSQLTKYADTQAKGFMNTARKVDLMLPQLDALCREVNETNKEYDLLRSAREEKRRALESSKPYVEPDAAPRESMAIPFRQGQEGTLNELGQTNSKASVPPAARERPKSLGPLASTMMGDHNQGASPRIPSGNFSTSPAQDKFRGIRDLEERDRTAVQPQDGSYRKEGILWSMSRSGSHTIDPKALNKQAWHKFWLVLDQGKLSEYVNWKSNMEQHSDPIDLRMASVREARNQERRFCFEVITPHFTRVYQATGEDDMRSWILAINNALQGAFEGKVPAKAQPPPDSTAGSIGRDLFGKSSSFHGHRSVSSSNTTARVGAPMRHATVAERPGMARSRSSEERPARLLQSIRDADVGNSWCADCGSDSRVEWVSINLGIILCIECSGIHRSLGTHITKIRSLTLDTVSFTQDIVELLLLIGNRVSNMVFEATLDPSSNLKPSPTSTRDDRQRFITAKYSDHAFVEPLSSGAPRFTTPDDFLLSSIKTNEIRNALYALALRGNPNLLDRSRATPALFLALAAADPASPSAASAVLPQGQPRKSFPLAELLIQNGADLPTTPPPILLSPSAKAYLEFKRDQKLGLKSKQQLLHDAAPSTPYNQPGPGYFAGGGGAANGADVLSPLPRDVGMGSAAGSGSGAGSAAGSMRDKLVKRGSIGARLVKPPGS